MAEEPEARPAAAAAAAAAAGATAPRPARPAAAAAAAAAARGRCAARGRRSRAAGASAAPGGTRRGRWPGGSGGRGLPGRRGAVRRGRRRDLASAAQRRRCGRGKRELHAPFAGAERDETGAIGEEPAGRGGTATDAAARRAAPGSGGSCPGGGARRAASGPQRDPRRWARGAADGLPQVLWRRDGMAVESNSSATGAFGTRAVTQDMRSMPAAHSGKQRRISALAPLPSPADLTAHALPLRPHPRSSPAPDYSTTEPLGEVSSCSGR